MKSRLLIAALIGLAAVPASAQGADDIASKIVNVPSAFRVDGAKGKLRDDKAVQGGRAMRVDVPSKGANAWDVGIASAITKPVKAGDQLVVAYWARLAKGAAGATSSVLPFNAIQLASAPYTPLFVQSVTVGPEWKLHEIRGKADKNYPADALNAAIHLATAKQTIDFGPIFVLNLGQ